VNQTVDILCRARELYAAAPSHAAPCSPEPGTRCVISADATRAAGRLRTGLTRPAKRRSASSPPSDSPRKCSPRSTARSPPSAHRPAAAARRAARPHPRRPSPDAAVPPNVRSALGRELPWLPPSWGSTADHVLAAFDRAITASDSSSRLLQPGARPRPRRPGVLMASTALAPDRTGRLPRAESHAEGDRRDHRRQPRR
jgi:hypothetical protein